MRLLLRLRRRDNNSFAIFRKTIGLEDLKALHAEHADATMDTVNSEIKQGFEHPSGGVEIELSVSLAEQSGRFKHQSEVDWCVTRNQFNDFLKFVPRKGALDQYTFYAEVDEAKVLAEWVRLSYPGD